MVEIIVLIILCKGNYNRAAERGKDGGGAVAYTLGLWLGLELLGILLALFLFGISAASYLFALVFAIVGGIISYQISSRGKIINPSHPEYFELSSPCTVRIFHSVPEDQGSKYFYYTNDQVHSTAQSNTMLLAQTNRSNNSISVRVAEEQFMRNTYQFLGAPGGLIEIYSSDGKFQPHLTKTIAKDNICAVDH